MVGSGAPLLEGVGIMRRYGARTVLAVDRIDVHAGEVLAIVGPNGAGKSTLFRALLLLENLDEGEIRLNGVVLRPGDSRTRGRLAGVFQRPVLFSGTVRDNVTFGLAATGVPRAQRRRRADDALGWMRLEKLADMSVHTLSGGEAQRVALARALAMEPDVVLLDEPTANLDVSIRREFRRDLEQVARQRARAVILITHDAGEAFGLADRVAVLDAGRVVQEGAPDDLVVQPATPFIAELTGAELLLHGSVETAAEGLTAIRLSTHVVIWAVPHPGDALSPGMEAVVSYRPEDVTLSRGDGHPDTSAVNRIPATVQAVVPAGALMRVRLRADDVALVALVTRRSVESMGLTAKTAVEIHLKAAALRAWRRDVHVNREMT
jgi:ABC-type sulfate/molybdate transport systems ATPase subunit